MGRGIRITSSLIGLLLLVACSSSSSSSGGGGSDPFGTTLDDVTSGAFDTVNVVYTTDPNNGELRDGSLNELGSALTVDFDDDTYTVTADDTLDNGETAQASASFDPADFIGSIGSIRFFENNDGGNTNLFAIVDPEAIDSTTQLDYSTIGYFFTEGNQGSANDLNAIAAGGFTTPVGDVPTSGGATYTGPVLADEVAGGTGFIVEGTAELDVDFTSSDIGLALTELTRYDMNLTAVGTRSDINGTGSLSGNGFSGTASDSTGLQGEFVGNFFGPDAVEAAGAFALTPTGDIVPGETDAIGGAFVTRR